MNVTVCLIILVSSYCVIKCSGAFRIGSFNVQVFGQKKSAKQEILTILASIVQRYDIILIQEIRDSSDGAIANLLGAVNNAGPHTYRHETSARLGRTVSKEQYSFFYRTGSGITVLDTYQFPDEKDDFQREPFAVRFKSLKTAVREFTLAAIHTDPDEALSEIAALEDVVDKLRRHWKDNSILVLGDFNAGCQYASKKALNNLNFRKNKQFMWLIPDDADTTATASKCAYDRFVITGESFTKSVESNSSRVFRYDIDFNLNNNQTLAVSDHYPIELGLKTSATRNRNTVELLVESSADGDNKVESSAEKIQKPSIKLFVDCIVLAAIIFIY